MMVGRQRSCRFSVAKGYRQLFKATIFNSEFTESGSSSLPKAALIATSHAVAALTNTTFASEIAEIAASCNR
jgi:hypothetical protein